MKENRVLEVKGIYKSFPGVKALQNVDFNLCEGEIHALMGETVREINIDQGADRCLYKR